MTKPLTKNVRQLPAAAGTVQIGDLTVNRIGLGTNRLTDTPQAAALLRRAVDLGVNFIDTAYLYQNGDSETAIGRTFASYREGLVVATKGGMSGATPGQLETELHESLQRLRTGCIDLYQLHRVDPSVPVEVSVEALRRFQEAGKIRHIGLSGVTVDQLERACRIAPIASVQNEYNLGVREQDAVVDYCTAHDIAFIPWFPLGGRRDGGEQIRALTAELTGKYHAVPSQIALAWLLKRSPVMLPIPGTLSMEHLEANVQAAHIELSDEDYRQLLSAV